MKQPTLLMERVIAGIALGLAFLVMGSIFVPGRSSAEEEQTHGAASHNQQAPHSGDARAASSRSEADSGPLLSLGSVDDGCYTVTIFASDAGPLYSVFSDEEGREIAALLSEDQLRTYFPELDLPWLTQERRRVLMLADPDAEHGVSGQD